MIEVSELYRFFLALSGEKKGSYDNTGDTREGEESTRPHFRCCKLCKYTHHQEKMYQPYQNHACNKNHNLCVGEPKGNMRSDFFFFGMREEKKGNYTNSKNDTIPDITSKI